MQNYNVVATGVSISEAQKSYFQKLSANGSNVSSSENTMTLTGVVTNFTSVVVEGNTRFYFNLDNSELIFIAPVSLSDELPLCQVGDEVTIKYMMAEGDQSVIINYFEK